MKILNTHDMLCAQKKVAKKTYMLCSQKVKCEVFLLIINNASMKLLNFYDFYLRLSLGIC